MLMSGWRVGFDGTFSSGTASAGGSYTYSFGTDVNNAPVGGILGGVLIRVEVTGADGNQNINYTLQMKNKSNGVTFVLDSYNISTADDINYITRYYTDKVLAYNYEMPLEFSITVNNSGSADKGTRIDIMFIYLYPV